MQEEKPIRGFRGAILIPVWALAFAGLADACLALEKSSGPRAGTGGITAPVTPNIGAGPRGQVGNKGGANVAPGDRVRTNDCTAAAAAGGNVTDCTPAKAAKGINAPDGSGAAPAPVRKASPCIGYPDRQCL